MPHTRPSIAALLVAGLAVSVAQAQVSQVAYTTDDDDPFGSRNTDAGLSVNDEAVVTTSNMRLSIFSRTGSLLDDRQVGDTDWPFLRADTNSPSDRVGSSTRRPCTSPSRAGFGWSTAKRTSREDRS